MTAHNQRLGQLGERIAERWLVKHGYRILARRFRNGHRDIDLIAQRDATIAFVEVKARQGIEFGDPVEAVHHRKRRAARGSGLTDTGAVGRCTNLMLWGSWWPKAAFW
jgi:putative endonuclease